MNANFIIKDKTEFYKEFMHDLEYAESDSFATKETVIIHTQTSEISVVFKFFIYYVFDGYYHTECSNFVFMHTTMNSSDELGDISVIDSSLTDELETDIVKFIKANYFDDSIFDIIFH